MTNDPTTLGTGDFADFSWLTGLSPLGWTFFFVLAVCYFIRRIKQIHNAWMIPVILVGALFFMFIGPELPKYTQGQNSSIKAAFGIIVGIFGCLAAWGLHDKACMALAQKWPIFSFLVSDSINPKPNNNP